MTEAEPVFKHVGKPYLMDLHTVPVMFISDAYTVWSSAAIWQYAWIRLNFPELFKAPNE